MNRVIIFILLSFVTSICYSKRISEQEAYTKAQQFLKGKKIRKSESSSSLASRAPALKNLYVFNAENNEGFVIISGDDRTRPVLGYSDTGVFDIERLPSNVRWLLDAYEEAIGSLNDNYSPKQMKTSEISATSDVANIEPLIKTQWGQGKPYNLQCPTYNGVQCLTGCVATAMAQVMNYYQWPQTETTSIEGYTSVTNKIQVPDLKPTTFNWDKMDDDEIAKLMRYCGQSVKMNYGPTESSSSYSKSFKTLKDNFHFGKGMLYEERAQYSDQEWFALILNQLQKGYPILYSGNGPGSRTETVKGHAFILDGFKEGLYHFNWGWNGSYDGYFSLDELKPTENNNYSLNQFMISNACPPVSINDSHRSKIVIQSLTTNQTTLTRLNPDNDFDSFVIKGSLACDLTENHNVKIGVAIADETNTLRILKTDDFDFWATDDDIQLIDTISITSSIPVGKYHLIAVNRANDTDEWLPDTRSHARYINVEITDTEMRLQPVKSGQDDVEYIEFGTITVNGLNFRLAYENENYRAYLQSPDNGASYSGDIYIPEYVGFESFEFKVIGEEDSPFVQNSNVASISSPISLKISDCQNLETIEYRDGVLRSSKIEGCPKLTKISYPSSCRVIDLISDCPKLAEMSFNNMYPDTICLDEKGGLWNKSHMPLLTDVFFYGDEPPMIQSANPSDNTDLKIHVPKGLKESFIVCGWQGWNIVDDLDKVEESLKWDYIGTDEDCNDGLIFTCGKNDVELAMKISSRELEKYFGNKIVAIEYFSAKHSSIGSIDFSSESSRNPDYVFITEKDKDYVVKQSTSAVRGSWTRVLLNTPYEITGEDIFVGVGRNKELTMNWANFNTGAGGFWYRPMGDDYSYAPSETPGTWYHNGGDSDFNFPMPIRAIIQGDNLPSDIAILNAEYQINEEKPLSEGGNISLKILNKSPRLVKDLVFELGYDGKRNESIAASTLLPANHVATINVHPEDLKFNTHFIELSANTIDGKADAVTVNSVDTLTLLATDLDHYPRITVLEDYTSRTDGYCVMNIAIKEALKSNFPDEFIAISVHKDSDMKLNDGSYDDFIKDAKSEYLYFNRSESIYNSLFSTTSNEISKKTGKTIVKSEAEFIADGRIRINTNTSCKEDYTENNEIDIAFVLVEDRVGPFEQYNSFKDTQYNYDYLNWWKEQQNKVEYMFDDVARTIHTYNGIEGLLPTEIVKDEIYESSYCMKVPNYVQNCENLKIVTLLIDKNTGEIINADRTAVSGIAPDLSVNLGDSNCDGKICIADAVNIANYVVGKDVEKFNYTASDVNNDGNLSFADASATVSLILNQPTPSAETESEYMKINGSQHDSDADVLLIHEPSGMDKDSKSIFLSLDNSIDYVALQADIILLGSSELDTIKIGKRLEKTHKLAMRKVDDKTIRVILFDLNNRTFIDSSDPLLEIVLMNASNSGNIKVKNIIASDSEAHDYVLTSDSESCGSVGISGDTNFVISPRHNALDIRNANTKAIVIYSCDGKEIVSTVASSDIESFDLSSGLYIVKVGGLTEKVVVK